MPLLWGRPPTQIHKEREREREREKFHFKKVSRTGYRQVKWSMEREREKERGGESQSSGVEKDLTASTSRKKREGERKARDKKESGVQEGERTTLVGGRANDNVKKNHSLESDLPSYQVNDLIHRAILELPSQPHCLARMSKPKKKNPSLSPLPFDLTQIFFSCVKGALPLIHVFHRALQQQHLF